MLNIHYILLLSSLSTLTTQYVIISNVYSIFLKNFIWTFKVSEGRGDIRVSQYTGIDYDCGIGRHYQYHDTTHDMTPIFRYCDLISMILSIITDQM